VSYEALTEKYIDSAEKVLKELQRTKAAVSVSEEDVAHVLGWAAD
jgi:hypothetical protein